MTNPGPEPTYNPKTRSWSHTCPCIQAEQQDPECPWHGREEALSPNDPDTLEGRCIHSHAQRGRCVLYEGHKNRYPYEDHVYPSAIEQRLHDIQLHNEPN